MDSSDDEMLCDVPIPKDIEPTEILSQTQINSDVNDPPSSQHLKVLFDKFGHKNFKSIQWKIIKCILTDKTDICAVMATGYGKSLCYQFPAVYSEGVTLVISPLISLMEDQVMSLTMKNISSCLLGSAQPNKNIIDKIFENEYSVIYLTPEFCTYRAELLEKMHSKLRIQLIAVDEAHCVSNWGHDFRPSFQKLNQLKNIFFDVPILAVTATATDRVKQDIVNMLNLRKPQMFCSGYDRPNLFFSVKPKSSSVLGDLKSLMVRKDYQWTFEGPTIIYCPSRKSSEDISRILNTMDVSNVIYHAGMTLNARKQAHEQFIRDEVSVIVATVAFGMGIDKPDIRNVIHYGAASCIEGYYQEVGRAGRDGFPSKCVAFYSIQDYNIYQILFQSSRNSSKRFELLNVMKEYLETRQCRRQFILSYFKSSSDTGLSRKQSCCDNCPQVQSTPDRDSCTLVPDHELYVGLDDNDMYDFTEDTVKFLSAVNAMNGAYGIGTYVLFLKGSKSSKVKEKHRRLPWYGSGNRESEQWWKTIANFLEVEHYLIKKLQTTSKTRFSYFVVDITDKGRKFLEKAQRGKKLIKQPSLAILKLLKRKKPQRSEWISAAGSSSSSTTLLAGSKSNNYAISIDSDSDESTDLTAKEVTEERSKLFRSLKDCRDQLARENNCKPYMIASDFVLQEMAKKRPRNLEQLYNLQIESLTRAIIDKFGVDFLNVLRNTFTGSKSNDDDPLIIDDTVEFTDLGDIKVAEDRIKLYKMLKDCRAQLSSENNCEFCEIASDYVLMEMAKHRPLELGELYDMNIQGLTRASIDKFGADLLVVIRDNGEKTTEKHKLSILDILRDHPVKNVQVNGQQTVLTTLSYFIKGLTLNSIADKRGLSYEAVFYHLLTVMTMGYPIKMEQLGVNQKTVVAIIQVINNHGSECSIDSLTTASPMGTTKQQIEVVCSYIKIRKHLDQIGIPYKEFESFRFEETDDDEGARNLKKLCELMRNEVAKMSDPNISSENNDAMENTSSPLCEQAQMETNSVLNSPSKEVSNFDNVKEGEDIKLENKTLGAADVNNPQKTSGDTLNFMFFEPVCKKAKLETSTFLLPGKEVINIKSKTVETAKQESSRTTLQTNKKAENACTTKKKLPQWLSKKR